MRKISLLILVAIISGCGTMPIPSLTEAASPAKTIQAPTERLLAYQERSPETGTIVVTRDTAFTGSACYYAVSINGKLSARLASGETAKFFVPPGDVLFISGHDPEGSGLCSPAHNMWAQTKLSLRPNETKFFRLSLEHPGQIIVQR